MTQATLKANFAVCSRHEAFFTGGRVQFSKDGQYMFCGCGNKVQVMSVSDGKLWQSICKEDDPEVSSFLVSPDDQHLIVASRELLLTQYDWKTNTVTRKWRAIHTTPVTCMTFDVSSTLLATGGSDHTVKVWDIIKQYCTHNLKGHTGVISAMHFHPDLELLQLFTAADDYHIRQWDLRKSACLHVFKGHYSAISSLELAPGAQTLVSAGRDSVVLCWDLEEKTKRTIPVYESVESLLVLDPSKSYEQFQLGKSDDLHVMTAGEKGVLKVWNTRTGHSVFSRAIGRSEPDSDSGSDSGPSSHISQTMFIPSLDALCVVTYQHNIILYSMAEFTVHKQFAGYNDDILDVKLFGPDDNRLAVATNTEQLKVFDTETWHCDILHGHEDIVMSVDVYKNGQIMVTGSKDKSIRIWRIEGGEIRCVAVGTGHSKAINTVAFSRSRPDFCLSAGEDSTLKLWQVSDALTGGGGGGGGKVRQLTAHITERAHEKDVNAVAVSPNDRFIVTASQDKTAKLWKADDLTLQGVFRGHKRGIWSVAFSPVDQAIATASADCFIKIWSITDFSCVKTFEGHQSSVLKVVFVARGMQVVSTDSEGLLKLWTIKTSECVKTFDEHGEKIWALCASKQDDRIVTGGADSNILVWKDVTEEEYQQDRAKKEDFIVKEQKLLNLLQQKKYVKAIALAITLEQPHRLFKILQTVIATADGDEELREVIMKLRPDQLGSVLRFAVNWNTNSRHCYEAQTVLHIVLKSFSPEEILEIPEIKTTIEGFLPYSERHFQRLSRLQQQACFVDYTLECMKTISNLGPRPTEESMETENETRTSEPFFMDRSGLLGAHQASEKTPADDGDGPKDVTMENKSSSDDSSDSEQVETTVKENATIATTRKRRVKVG